MSLFPPTSLYFLNQHTIFKMYSVPLIILSSNQILAKYLLIYLSGIKRYAQF